MSSRWKRGWPLTYHEAHLIWGELDWNEPNMAVVVFNIGAILATSMVSALLSDRFFSDEGGVAVR